MAKWLRTMACLGLVEYMEQRRFESRPATIVAGVLRQTDMVFSLEHDSHQILNLGYSPFVKHNMTTICASLYEVFSRPLPCYNNHCDVYRDVVCCAT